MNIRGEMMEKISTIIAEDDTQNAEILSQYIGRLNNFKIVGIAQSLLQATELVDIAQPNLIILDHYFPDGKGTELLQHIRHNEYQTDVIMVTAAKDVETIRSAMFGGIFDYLIKPISYQRLDDSLKKYQEYISRIRAPEQFHQHDVDRLLKHNTIHQPVSADRLPKGIDSLTLNKVRAYLGENIIPITAEKLGESLNISRTTARRYLEYLVSLNEVKADVNYGGVGRPERIYIGSKK